MIYKTNVDLVNDNVYTKFGLNRFVLKILSKNSILTSIKGRYAVANLPKFGLIQFLCMASIPARMKKIQLKMKALEFSQDCSHYKSMGIFPDAQGQVTPQSLVRSGPISNSSDMLWFVSLPAKMKKIRSKMSAHNIIHQFFRRARADNSGVGGGIWPKFELIQAFMHVLVTCKNEDDRFKNEGASVRKISPIISL